MITHYIIMSSSYSKGKRIALDNLLKEKDYEKLRNIVQDIVKECGRDVSLSTHFIQTDSESFESVIEKDPFFKGVEVIESKEEFIKFRAKFRGFMNTQLQTFDELEKDLTKNYNVAQPVEQYELHEKEAEIYNAGEKEEFKVEDLNDDIDAVKRFYSNNSLK